MSKKNEIISGLVFLCLSIFIFIQSFFINKLSGGSIGPDFLPKIVSVFMGILSIMLLIKAFKMPNDEKIVKNKSKFEFKKWFINNKDIVTIVLILLYLIIMKPIGFIISTIIYLSLQISLFREKKIKFYIENLVISVITSVVVYYIFVNILSLMLPSGILG